MTESILSEPLSSITVGQLLEIIRSAARDAQAQAAPAACETLSFKEVCAVTGLSSSTIERRLIAVTFPPPIRGEAGEKRYWSRETISAHLSGALPVMKKRRSRS